MPNRNTRPLMLFVLLVALTCCASTLMGQDSGLKAAKFLGAIQNPGITPNAGPGNATVKLVRPTVDPATYAALKEQAAATSGTKSDGGLAPKPQTVNIGFDGLDRFGSADLGFVYTPPDVNSASGLGQVAEITNNHYACFDTVGNVLQNTPASLFFGYTPPAGKYYSDPRVVYDTIWNRWIVTEVEIPESPNIMNFFLAVSTTSDCFSPFYVYAVNEVLAPNDFYDYPQVGYDQDAIIVTFNVFNGAFKYGEINFWAKARVYNGLSLSVPFITGYGGTLTPNTARDQSGATIVLENVAGTNQVQLIKLTNTAKINPSSSTVNVTTPEVCAIPRDANQPGTSANLDTIDGRFQAPGVQNGAFVWNVQTCGISGFPIPRVLQININTNTVAQRDFVFLTPTSDDFNPSLAVNDVGDLLVNWSSTDAPAGLNAGMETAARPSGGLFNFTGECFRSTTFSTAHRWGDTSGTSVDFTDPTQQTWWVSNEKIEDALNWGTNICQISRP